MKIYAHYGFKDFVLCLGYKGEILNWEPKYNLKEGLKKTTQWYENFLR